MKTRKWMGWGFWLLGLAASSANYTDTVFVLHISDAIHVGTEEYLHRGLETARNARSSAILIEIDTPGGYLESTRKIVQEMLASETKIIVWVTPSGARAASAGSMITMAAHFAAMSPSTSIGAATPVNGDGKDVAHDMRAKITNDTMSFVEGIASKRHRNIDWARKSVSEAASLSSEAAVKEKVVDSIVSDREDLWKKFHAKYPDSPENPVFSELPQSLKENVLSFLSNPNIAYGLLALGSIGLYMELGHPGAMVPGVVGVLSLAISGISMKIIPIEPGSIALFVIAIILFFIEFMTAIPTHGSAGIGGVIAIFLSGIFWMDPSQSNLRLNAGFWLPAFLVISGFTIYFLYSSVKAIRGHSHNVSSTLMVGKIGSVRKVVDAETISVFVEGALWNASLTPGAALETTTIKKGDEIEVVDQSNLKLIIKRKDS